MNVLITGGSNGLGRCIVEELARTIDEIFIYNLDIDSNLDLEPLSSVKNIYCDISELKNVLHVYEKISDAIDVIINCAGINLINPFEALEEHNFNHCMSTNAKAIFYTTRIFLEDLKANCGTVLNIISNASHMPMTHSLSYNASKAAAEIMTRQLARELTKKYGITVFGISPNKLKDTKMSEYIDNAVPSLRGWSFDEAKAYQLNALVTGEETDPRCLAEFIGFLLAKKERHKYLSGCIIPYGA